MGVFKPRRPSDFPIRPSLGDPDFADLLISPILRMQIVTMKETVFDMLHAAKKLLRRTLMSESAS